MKNKFILVGELKENFMNYKNGIIQEQEDIIIGCIAGHPI